MGMGTVDHHHHRVCRLKCWAALLAVVAAVVVVAVMEAEVIMVAVLHTVVAIHIQAVAAA